MDFKGWHMKQKMKFRDTMKEPMHLVFGPFKEVEINNRCEFMGSSFIFHDS